MSPYRGEAQPTPWLKGGKRVKNSKGELGWRIRFRQEGYPKVEKVFYGSRAAAFRELARLQNEQLQSPPSGRPTNRNVGWLEFLTSWVASYRTKPDGTSRARTTYKEHERSLSLITPLLKKKRLDKRAIAKVSPAEVQEVLLGFRMKDGSEGTAAARGTVQKTLRMSFASAVQDGLILHSPVKGDASWRVKERDLDAPAPTLDEVMAICGLIEKDGPSYIVPMPVVIFLSGMRVSEALALRLADTRLDDQVFFIRQKRTVSGGRLHYGDNKTIRSRRSIPILNEALPFVVQMYERALELKSDYLFVGSGKRPSRKNSDGQFITAASSEAIGYSSLSKVWRENARLAHKKGLVRAEYRIHDLRHGFATEMLSLGIPEERVSSMLGHESVRTTTQIYRHATEAAQFQEADAITEAWEAKKSSRRPKAIETLLKTRSDPDYVFKRARELDKKYQQPTDS